ncbi:hypothetical protein EMCRGX_G026503 [Ephydatia muelleri]
MDIVGPLPRTKSGNRFILVTCDYGTRYPEAVPVKAIDAEHIAEELVRIFAHVGIQEKIMTNQGSNFTSLLLSEIYELFHVHPIRKTPYHSQIDCLVERFNKTLKAMLRKIAVADHLNWDGWVYTGKVLYGRYKEIARFSWFRGKKNEAKSPPPLKSYFVYPLAMRLHVGCCDQPPLQKVVHTLTFQARAWSVPRTHIWKAFATNAFQTASVLRQHVFKRMLIELGVEFLRLSSDSTLLTTDCENLKQFDWDKLYVTIQSKAPLLMESWRSVYCRLQKLGICLSDVATWSLIDKLGIIEVAKAIYVTQAKVAKAIEVAEANTIEEAIEATEAISI